MSNIQQIKKQRNEYIYIRTHPAYDTYNCCKLGKTTNIPERDSQYATGEVVRGNFLLVIQLHSHNSKIIERLLQEEFIKYNIKYDGNELYNGGNEFFKKDIITLIESYLLKKNIPYNILSCDEINELKRIYRVKNLFKKLKKYKNLLIKSINQIKIQNNRKKYISPMFSSQEYGGNVYDTYLQLNEYNSSSIIENKNQGEELNQEEENRINYIPREYQKEIINSCIDYFSRKNKGILALTCGVGKTLISLWIALYMKCNKIVIGVPNILLLTQWNDVVKIIFPNVNVLIVSGNIDINNIKSFLENNHKCIIITTYSSSYKVNYASKLVKFKFDIKILDEVHHLTSRDIEHNSNGKKYIKMLNIQSKKQLSLTATLKLINDSVSNFLDSDNEFYNYNDEIERTRGVISNDNIKQFGEIIEKRPLLWAIENNIVCDYEIITLQTDEDKIIEYLVKFNIITDNDKRLLFATLSSLMALGNNTNHLLIITNNKDNANKIIKFINLLLENNYFVIPDLMKSIYHSDMRITDKKQVINNFKKSKFGIISCVYCLGEGWDLPLLDGVVFAENMTSEIRIVQTALRASRKNNYKPDKKAKIILPILENDDWLDNSNSNDFIKIKEVIYQMSQEDVTILQKLTVKKINPFNILNKERKNYGNNNNEFVDNFGEYDDELTKKLRLKINSRLSFGININQAMKIILSNNINSKDDYYALCEKDIRLPKNPKERYGDKFINWVYYLSIERKYYEKSDCIIKVKEYLLQYPLLRKHYLNSLKITRELCNLDSLFPPYDLWCDYYNVINLNEIIIVDNIFRKKKSRVVL